MDDYNAARIAICVIGIVANIVVLLVLVIKRELLKNSSKRYILQLALADLVFLVSGIGETAYRELAKEKYTNAGCQANKFIFYVTYHASILFIMAMAIDRYCAINHGFSDFALKIRSWRVSVVVIAAVWLMGAAFSLPAILYGNADDGSCRLAFPVTKEDDYSNSSVPIACKFPDHSTAQDAYFWLEFTLMFLVPIVAIAICYGLIFIHIIKSTKRSTGRCFDPRRRAPLLTCLVLILLFIACWTPHHVRILLFMTGGITGDNWRETSEYCFHLSRTTTILVLVNSAINPFVYFIMINLPQQMRNLKKRIQGLPVMPSTSSSRLNDTDGALAQDHQSTVPIKGANTNQAYLPEATTQTHHETKV